MIFFQRRSERAQPIRPVNENMWGYFTIEAERERKQERQIETEPLVKVEEQRIMGLYNQSVQIGCIGGCLDQEFEVWSKGLLRDFQDGTFRLVLSTIVAAEIASAIESVQAQYEDFLVLESEILEVTEPAIALAEAYQRRQILKPKYYPDGLHIALATVAEVDVLVSWNFKHIVHFNKIRLFNAVMGYKPLQIYSPREVTTHGTD